MKLVTFTAMAVLLSAATPLLELVRQFRKVHRLTPLRVVRARS